MKNLYCVLSLNLATWLKMHNHPILKTEKKDNKTVFYFEKNDELSDCINAYNDNQELKLFISTYKDIRGITKGMR